jgi:hypothetical protein
MRRLARGVWSGFWLAVLLIGLPYVLIRYVGWRWPLAPTWRQLVAHPFTTPVLVDLATAIVWLLWAVLLYALVVDIARRVRRIRLRLPNLPTPVQAAASSLLGATVLTLSAPPTPAQAAPIPVTPATATLDQPASVPAPATPPPATPSASTAADRATATTQRPVRLPAGGWIDHHTAAAIAQAATAVWVGRRRRYIPRPTTPTAQRLADLTPLPPTVTAIQTALAAPPDDEADQDVDATDPAVPLLRPADLPGGGVGLTGPGAPDALRGLIVAALYGPGRDHEPAGDDQPVVVLTTRMKHALAIPDTPGVLALDTIGDALTTLETMVLRRHQPPPGTPASNDPPHPAADGTPQPLPLGVLAAHADAATVHRIAVLAALSAATDARILIHGPWPGSTWTIDADGTATSPAGRVGRLCCLSALAAADLLQILTPNQLRVPRQHQPAATTPTDHQTAAAHLPHPVSGRTALSDRDVPRLQLLGRVILQVAGRPIHFKRTKALPLLTYLVLHPDIAMTKELCTALWPQLPANATKDRLSATLTSIRNATQPLDLQLVIRDQDGYRLNREQVTVDLWQLHDAALHADTSPPDERTAAWHRVTDLYTGALADGWGYGWLDPHREAARRIALDAYTALADEQPETSQAVRLLHAAVPCQRSSSRPTQRHHTDRRLQLSRTREQDGDRPT